MRSVATTIDIARSPDQIWPIITEFAWWPCWGLSISDVESDARQVAPGVTGRVRTRLGLWLPFTIENVVADSFWDWSVAGVRATGHHLVPGAGHTEVRFTAPWPAAPYTVVMKASLRRLKAIVESQ